LTNRLRTVARGTAPDDRRLLSALASRRLLYVLVGLGAALRVAQYVANRSLWLDEASLALNLLSRSFVGLLTKPLDFGQGAPPAFLFTEELASRVFGFSEYALRLFPLVCGIAALIGFAWLARRVLPHAAAPLAVMLFAVADGFIYYSSELKPYSGDVAVAVALLIAALKLGEDRVGTATAVFLAVGGLLLVAFSFPAVFLIAGAAATLVADALLRKRRVSRLGTAIAVSCWLLGSAAVAAFAASRLDEIRSGSRDGFLGVYGSSTLAHALNVFGSNIAAAMGFVGDRPFNHVQKLALLLVVVGVVSFLRHNPVLLAILIIPFALAFAASGLDAYLLAERTELFLVPSLILLLVEGVATVVRQTPDAWRPVVALTLSVAVASGPLYLATKRLLFPRKVEEIRPVLVFVRDHWRAGDTLYLDHDAQYAFLYYKECNCLRLTFNGAALWPIRGVSGQSQADTAVVSTTPSLVVGSSHQQDPNGVLMKLRMLRGRTWFVYSHFESPSDAEFIEQRLVGTLDDIAMRVAGIDRRRAHAYLYEIK
jgi:Dolichyl-phosphate-mannose-protein mannosyltransferase